MTVKAIIQQAQHQYGRLKTKSAASSPSTQGQPSKTDAASEASWKRALPGKPEKHETSPADLEDVLQQARHSGFDAKIHIDRVDATIAASAQETVQSTAQNSTQAAPEVPATPLAGEDDQQSQLLLAQNAGSQPASSSANLTELVGLLTTHGLNLSNSLPVGNTSQAALAELNLSQETAQVSENTSDVTQLPTSPSPGPQSAAASTADSASPQLQASTIAASSQQATADPTAAATADATHAEQSHIQSESPAQAMPTGLHQQLDTHTDTQTPVQPSLAQPHSQHAEANSSLPDSAHQQHIQDATAFSGVFNSTEQDLSPLLGTAANHASNIKPQHSDNATLSPDGNSTEHQMLNAADADPSVNYSPEQAIVEPAEPISLDMHREEEAHKAVVPLLVQHANVSGKHKLTR